MSTSEIRDRNTIYTPGIPPAARKAAERDTTITTIRVLQRSYPSRNQAAHYIFKRNDGDWQCAEVQNIGEVPHARMVRWACLNSAGTEIAKELET